MTGRRAALAVALLAIGSLGACSGDDDATTGATAGAAVTTATEPPATDAARTSTTGAAASTEAPATTAAEVTTPSTTVAAGVVPGVPTLELATSGAGLGPRPILRWEAVDGAAAYVVSVNDPGGGPLWAWEGPGTEVPFGGGPADDPDTTGARLTGPATWFVAAKGADGTILAASAPADLAP